MAWLPAENKLDRRQREFIEQVDFNKRNVWIKGFPGSGKSVLLAYSLRKIKRNYPTAKVAVVVFTRSLIAMFRAAFAEMGVAANIITFYEFMDSYSNYDYILSDEVQDMTDRVLSTMKNRAKHVIVAGDEHQSIYDRDPKYKEATVSSNQIGVLLDSDAFPLNEIHRLSSTIIAAVQKFMPDMNIFEAARDMTKATTEIRLCNSDGYDDEVKYIMREAQKAINVGDTAAILIPKKDRMIDFFQRALINAGKTPWPVTLDKYRNVNFSSLNSYLSRNGIKMQYVGNGHGSFTENTDKICVMTYHSSKGLDFDNVFLPGLNRGLEISPIERLSRTLFMVAMTRSRNNLYLTYSGSKSPYLNSFAGLCSSINIQNALNNNKNTRTEDNIFDI